MARPQLGRDCGKPRRHPALVRPRRAGIDQHVADGIEALHDLDQRRRVRNLDGKAQPPIGRYSFCQRLLEFAAELGVERVFTFAAMATPMRPEHDSRVFAAAAVGLVLATTVQLGRRSFRHVVDLVFVALTVVAVNLLHLSVPVALLGVGALAILWYRPQ